jgi:hypothetical protein
MDPDMSWEEKLNHYYHWLHYTCDGVINAVKYVHFQKPEYDPTGAIYRWAVQSLKWHHLADFEIPIRL